MSVRDAGRVDDDLVVARLRALAPHLDGEPDPAWQSVTRARLVAMAAVRSPEPAPPSPLRRLFAGGLPTGGAGAGRGRTRLTAGLAGAALGLTALATLVAVADTARPGDALYGLKRGTEHTQLALAGDARGEVLLDLAGTRLDEARALAGAGPVAAGLVVGTLATMDAQTADGAAELTRRAVESDDPGPLVLLAAWTGRQSDGLSGLRDDVPAAAEDDVGVSLDLLADLATRVRGLHASLGCADGAAVAGADELGPVPAPCPSDGSTARTTGQAADGSAPGSGVPDPGSASAPGPSSGAPAPSAPPAGGVAPEVPARPGDGGMPAPSVPALPTGPSLPSGPVPIPQPVLPVPTPLPPPPGVLTPPPGGSLPLPGAPSPLPGLPGAVPTPVPPPTSDVDVCLPPIRIAGC